MFTNRYRPYGAELLKEETGYKILLTEVNYNYYYRN